MNLKMVQSCVVGDCKNETYPGCGISFHRFPANETLNKKWREAIITHKKISKHSLVCSKHFKNEDFLTQAKNKLQPQAVPSIFTAPFESPRSNELDSLSLDLVLSVDRNIKSNQLMITLDPTAVSQNDAELVPEHNYALKIEDNVEIKEEIPDNADFDEYDAGALDTSKDEVMKHDEINNSHLTNMLNAWSTNEDNSYNFYSPPHVDDDDERDYKQKYTCEWYKNKKLTEITSKQRLRIDELQRTCRLLRQRLTRRMHRQNKLKELKRALINYTHFKEIDNILNGRFLELCRKVGKNRQRTYSEAAMKFAITLFYLSPKCYNLVKRYIKLPEVAIIKKYLKNRTFVINLNEFDLDDDEI